MIRTERSKLIVLRNQGKLDDEVVRHLERDLDLEEQHVSGWGVMLW